MRDPIDARALLTSRIGHDLRTLTGRVNRILDVTSTDVIVATSRSPAGQPVPIAWVQSALDRLFADGEVEISVESVGYRSAFIGAVLATVPAAIARTRPRRIVLAIRESSGAGRSDPRR
jgi:hypothetical protein